MITFTLDCDPTHGWWFGAHTSAGDFDSRGFNTSESFGGCPGSIHYVDGTITIDATIS